MKASSLNWAISASLLILAAGCAEQNSIESADKSSAEMIANEADKGNLAPLRKLNEACALEVERTGARASSCRKQDYVGSIRKPFKLRH